MKLPSEFAYTSLMNPWALLLLVAVLAVLAAELTAKAPGVVTISTGETLRKIPGGRRRFLRRLPALLRAFALTLLVIAMARPIMGYTVRKDRANVTDIILCVDVSRSMMALDFIANGQRLDRLAVTKAAVRDFLNNRKQRREDRFGMDRIGLVLYSTYAWTACPLTLDYGVLEREVERAGVNEQDEKRQSTAIGSAIGLAVSRLRKSEAKSKVIVLLTDGLNNAGELGPMTAARLAKEYGIRIYTIGAGSVEGGMVPVPTPFGMFVNRAAGGIDEDALKKIASATGGKYYRATDFESLAEAYAEINKLETTEIEVNDYVEHKEGFMPFALAGAALMLVSAFSRRLWFDTIP
jgi:Ca-activated chloride channel family protein